MYGWSFTLHLGSEFTVCVGSLRTSELAERAKVPVSTLRHYERTSLLPLSARSTTDTVAMTIPPSSVWLSSDETHHRWVFILRRGPIKYRMATTAPTIPKSNQPMTEPMIHAAFRRGGKSLEGRLATSTTVHMTNMNDAA